MKILISGKLQILARLYLKEVFRHREIIQKCIFSVIRKYGCRSQKRRAEVFSHSVLSWMKYLLVPATLSQSVYLPTS